MPQLFLIKKPPAMSTLPDAHSSLVPGMCPLLWVGKRCSGRAFCNIFLEIEMEGRIRLYPCAEQAKGLSQRPGILVWGTKGRKIQGQVLLKLNICKGEKAGDKAVCRGWGSVLQIMPPTMFSWLAMFLALLFKECFSEERRNSRKLQIQPCMEMWICRMKEKGK